ncbi:hypothetical protein SAMN05421858_3868 [Haladaptatus litoreus]|uniref:ABM domain-containing protein n=1 Tax=Haladaptatus litoreus TaxID=553468 RepID=A0A1N7DYZ4_9EURY|nr:DUF6176 family protein [Haladaptatus litoreus]SIR81049.1 hypothetical protein SAMN05421858_3868 [Haladaptatus litoreus]
MSEVVLVRQQLRPRKTEKLREWCAELEAREDEVMETLDNERVFTEARFLRSSEDGDFLFTFMEADDIEATKEAVEASEFDIDDDHAEVMDDVLVSGSTELLTPLDYFSNSARM